MNQIIFINSNENELISFDNESKNIPNKSLKFYKFLLFFSIILIIICFSSYILLLYNLNKKENLSYNISNNFKLTRLYSNNSDYIVERFSNSNIDNTSTFKVIGLIEIDKIQISYPFFSDISEELLKIAPCKFFRTRA